MKTIISYLLAFCLLIYASACNKQDFLDANPDQSMVVPKTLSDYQAILDNDLYMNGTAAQGVIPQMLETGGDNYFVPDNRYNVNLSTLYQHYYVWAKDLYDNEPVYDWNIPYRCVFYSNVVLSGLANISVNKSNLELYDNITGSALFFRALCFYELTQVFAPPYKKNTAAEDWGIPLPLSADINGQIQRATLKETYDRIIADLNKAATLLPKTPLYKTRPSKPATYALLARVYQTMGDYDQALNYADSSLQLQSALLDYNSLDPNVPYPIPLFNKEVIFHCDLNGSGYPLPPIYPAGIAKIDTTLYDSYLPEDLRKKLFFRKDPGTGYQAFQGSYHGAYNYFAGLATDEVYLIRAECYARMNRVGDAMNDLNTLLVNRWRSGTFVPYTAADANQALEEILTERRKELCFRGLRWIDLRRLNMDPRFAVTLIRKVNGKIYTLPPNDPRYTIPIPPAVMGFHPDMPQNPR